MSDATSQVATGLRALSRAGATVAGGEVASKLLVLARNAVVANLISRDDFGLAATFTLTVTALELASDVGVRQFVIQNPRGDDPSLQRAAHLWNMARGVLLGLVLLAAAPLVAALFDAPSAVDDFRLLALVPVIKGVVHLDPARFQRRMRFGPAIADDVVSELAATGAAIAFALSLGDQRAILYALLVRAVVSAVVTRIVADRGYRVDSDRATFSELVSFGWPLLLNGLVIFAILQGDRLLVGAFYDLGELAGYSVAFGLAVMPALMIARVNGQLLLPVLAGAQEDDRRFLDAYERSTEALGLVSSLLAAGFVTVGPVLIVLLYGEQYADTAVLLGVLGAMQAVRVLRAAPSQAALARGETRNTMQANVARFVGLGVALWLAAVQAPLVSLAITGLVAEAVALLVATLLLSRTHQIPSRITLVTAARSAVVPVVAAVAVLLVGGGTWQRIVVGLVAAGLVVPVTTRARTRTWLRHRLARAMGDDDA